MATIDFNNPRYKNMFTNRGELLDTVYDSMTTAITMLHPIALMNSNSAMQKTYFDVKRGGAIAGFRREVADLGVLLVRLQYGEDNEVNPDFRFEEGNMQVNEKAFQWNNGSFHYVRKEYLEDDGGLPGLHPEEEYDSSLPDKQAVSRMEAVRQNVEGHYELNFSPNSIFEFLKKYEQQLGGMEDFKINIQSTSGVPPAGTVLATCEVEGNYPVLDVRLPKKDGIHIRRSYVSKKSKLSAEKLVPGAHYIVKPDFIDKSSGKKYVNVLSRFRQGTRIAMQHIKNGFIAPGDPGYEVNPNSNNGIPEKGVADMPFMEIQDTNKLVGAPMLTFDLDAFYNLMHVMSGYPVATMQFKNAVDGVYFKAEGHEYMPHFEAILGPTIPYIRGKVWLP